MCSICGRRFATARFAVRGGRGWPHSIAQPWAPISSPMTHMVYLLLFFELLSWLQKRFCPPVQPIYNDKYSSRSYRFVERQKPLLLKFPFQPMNLNKLIYHGKIINFITILYFLTSFPVRRTEVVNQVVVQLLCATSYMATERSRESSKDTDWNLDINL